MLDVEVVVLEALIIALAIAFCRRRAKHFVSLCFFSQVSRIAFCFLHGNCPLPLSIQAQVVCLGLFGFRVVLGWFCGLRWSTACFSTVVCLRLWKLFSAVLFSHVGGMVHPMLPQLLAFEDLVSTSSPLGFEDHRLWVSGFMVIFI